MEIVDKLLDSTEPAIRFKTLTEVLGTPVDDPKVARAQRAIRRSKRVVTLLGERDEDGRIPFHPYAKWRGAHWVLVMLGELDYPPVDKTLIPLREQVYAWLFGPSHTAGIRTIAGRVRRCASQEGNALWATLKLGLADERTDELARRLCAWQWPDGGWNCDKNPAASHSSFMESLIPMRALALFAEQNGDKNARVAAERTAEIMLKRRLYRREHGGAVIRHEFTQLHYPCYWHYDILFALKVMAEAGFIGDSRCADALDLLESKRLPDGGFPAEGQYYRTWGKPTTGYSAVDWGGTSKLRMNEWVSVNALAVLRAAGRL